MPGYGRHAPRVVGVWAVHVMVLTANYIKSLCPPNGSGPGINPPIFIFMLFTYLARFPMPSGHPTRAVNVPNAQTINRGGTGTLWYISLVYATPCAQNQNGTCHLQLMALLMALTAN